MTNALTSNALFGDLLRDAEIAAEFSDSRFLSRMVAFEEAWTRALEAVEAVGDSAASDALRGLARFQPDMDALAEGSNRDGLPIPALVAQLKAQAGSGAEALHAGATSQDVIDTAMVLTLRDVATILSGRLQSLIAALDDLSAGQGAAPLMGRTRMQAALPITAGARIAAWRAPLADHLTRLDEVMGRLSQVQAGGAVGLRDKPRDHGNEAAAHVAQELGLMLGPVWHADRSPMVAFGAWLSLVAGSLGKFGQDIALMAQQGIDEVSLRGGGGSSAMPHKQNPVRAELLVGLARYVAAQQGGLGQAMVHEQERSGAAWALEWLILPAMAEATGAALRHANALVRQIERIGRAED